MPLEITMPQLGLTMETGTIAKWLVAVDDAISEGQPLVEIETDKAVVAVESQHTGTVARILAEEGAEVAVGVVIAIILKPGEKLPADTPPAQTGRTVAAQASLADAPRSVVDRAPSQAHDVQASWKARVAARKAGLDIGSVKGTGAGGRVTAQDISHALESPVPAAAAPVKASPAAAKMADVLGLDLSTVKGTGGQGRIMEEDVLNAAASIIRSARTAQPARPLDAVSSPAPRAIPLKGARALVSRRMSESAKAAARVTLFRELDASALVDFRNRYKALGMEIAYNDILVRVCALALREHPEANARMGDGQIEQLGGIHIGVAVDTERGLLVPVIRDADALSIPQIAAESARLIQEARSGRIAPDSLVGGTFTITNLGMFGVEGFTPIINLPECCILGVGRIVRKPAVCGKDESIAVRSMLTLSLSFDHRVIDGAPAARFLDRIVQFVLDPWLLVPLA